MKLLAIETSTMLGGVAIMDDDTLIAESRINIKVTHSERIMGEIDHILMRSGLTIREIDVICISIGPGSFTGLRVGLSAAKGLVYAANCKLVAVPTLEAFAWNIPFSMHQVCPLLDARKKEVYAAIFKWTDSGFIRVVQEQAVRIDDLLSQITSPTIFIGEGAVMCRDMIEKKLDNLAIFTAPQCMVTSPSAVAFLGIQKAKRGEFADPINLVPMYLRKSEAEKIKEKR